MIGVPKAPQKVSVYKAGRAKLLAQIVNYDPRQPQGPELASKNSEFIKIDNLWFEYSEILLKFCR